MIVKPKHRKLLLRLRHPEKILSVIPTAKTLEFRGKQLVVVPHRLDEYKVLTNLGLDPPHPVDYYYDWPGRDTPLVAQKETVRLLTSQSRAYCHDDMGLGKTRSTLWSYDFLRAEGCVKKMLVVAPLSTLERTWGDELFMHFPHLEFAILHGSRQQRLALLENPDIDVFVINHDGIKVILADLVARTDIDLLAIDELSQVARNASTGRWKALRALVDNKKYAWGLTGTPIPNAPTDAWAQCQLLTPHTVPRSSLYFKQQVMIQVSQFIWKPREDALETVYRVMQPSIRHKRSEALDLPPVMYETREVPLTTDQARLYKEMMEEFTTQYKGGEITAVNAAVKASKLVQIACGAALDPHGQPVFIPSDHRLKEVESIIQQAASKVIVFVPFIAAVQAVNDFLKKKFSTGVIYGAVSKKDRDEILGNFQHSKDPHVLIAQPGAMSHGLTLTAASVIVWFAPTSSAEIYEQANARITRPGQKLNQLIVHIQGSPVESKMYTTLRNKTALQSQLLELFAKS